MRPLHLAPAVALAALASLASLTQSACGGDGTSGSLGTCGGVGQGCCTTGDACGTGLFCTAGACTAPGRSPVDLRFRSKVDVLFMVDDSPSMEAMARELRNRFPQFFAAFGDLARQGFSVDMHLGVITSDYGAGASGAPGCDRSGGGRQGKLQPVGRAAPPNCLRPIGADYVQYIFSAGGAAPSNLPPGQDLLQTFTCMASVGAGGCGFEHQLESTYAALHNTAGTGFLRDDAVLAIVFLTNEDDCSAPAATDLFSEQAAGYGYLDSYRCSRFGVGHGKPAILLPYGDSGGALSDGVPAPNADGKGPGLLYDVQRYIDYFTRPAALGGVKPDPADVVLVGIDAPATPLQTILSDPGTPAGSPYTVCTPLNEKIVPPCVPVLQHSCRNDKAPQFFGDPAVRLNAVIAAAAHHGTSSICDDDYSAALRGVGDQIASELGLGCIGNRLPDDPNNPGQILADCVVTDVTMAGGMSSVYEIPRCAAPATVFPCWRLDKKPGCSAQSPQSLGVTIDRNGAPTPPNANIHASCVTLR